MIYSKSYFFILKLVFDGCIFKSQVADLMVDLVGNT